MALSIKVLIVASQILAGGPLNLFVDDLECTKIKAQIREIQSKMRSGYTRAQGEKMEAKLRKLKILRSKACR